ncbi:glycosyltransferase [uncultured Polaribacter sp.]|uniref:glycosyltransferase n=1 Tax=uncultured Polaribacter sp. TaxID=174711 RepID=UPI00261A7526|nr:glycosyltransferase [uncultured Polaribacter sp.]
MKKIIVSVTNDLTTDQRVAKVCDSLKSADFEILLIGRKLKNSLPLERDYKTKRIRLLFNKGFLFYATYNCRLFFILLFTKADILLANDLDTLLPNYLVSKLKKQKLVYDSHELFPEIPELVHKKFVKNIWSKLEGFFVPKIENCYTVCDSIANYYKNKYQTKFKVIKNLPLQKNRTKTDTLAFKTNHKKIILYQGSVNLGRGLELIIETMPYLPNYVLLIVGTGDIIEDLKQLVQDKNLQQQVNFLGRKTPSELQQITPIAKLGISLEEDLGLNYRYALPNKIFDYIQAEVPILVSNLPEMKQIVTHYNVGEIVQHRKPEKLAEQIKNLAEKDFKAALKNAKETLIWEQQEDKLLTIFKNLV